MFHPTIPDILGPELVIIILYPLIHFLDVLPPWRVERMNAWVGEYMLFSESVVVIVFRNIFDMRKAPSVKRICNLEIPVKLVLHAR